MNRANGRIQWFPPTGKIVLYIGHFRSCQSNPILFSSFDDPPPSIGLNLYPQPSATTISPDSIRTATCVGSSDSPATHRLALLTEPPLARKSVWSGKSVSVRLNPGCPRHIKQKKTN